MANSAVAITVILASAIACCVKAPGNDAVPPKNPLTKNLGANELCAQAGGAKAPVDSNGFTVTEYVIQGGNPQNSVDVKRWFNVRFKVKNCANLDTYKNNKNLAQPTIDQCIIDCDLTKNGGWAILECKQHGGGDEEIKAYEAISNSNGLHKSFTPVKGSDKPGKFDLTCKNWLPPSITHHV